MDTLKKRWIPDRLKLDGTYPGSKILCQDRKKTCQFEPSGQNKNNEGLDLIEQDFPLDCTSLMKHSIFKS
jgi:hypothetical protein